MSSHPHPLIPFVCSPPTIIPSSPLAGSVPSHLLTLSCIYKFVLWLTFVFARPLTSLVDHSFAISLIYLLVSSFSHSLPIYSPFYPFLRPSNRYTDALSSSNRALFVQPRYAKMLSSQRLHRHLGRPLPDPSEPAIQGSLAPSPALAPTLPKVE